jgi:ABC-type branched-subunit amino acid transport system substrate-binding protein
MMKSWGSNTVFATSSFVGSDALGMQLSNKGVGVVISQVVPYPYDKRVPLVAQYHKFTGQFVPQAETGYMGLEGFIAAKALCEIMKNIQAPFTRENFIMAAEKQSDTELGGIKITFSPENHQGVNDVFFTQVVPGGFIKPVGNLEDLYN